MRHIRFYNTEESARSAEQTLGLSAGVSQVYLYKCRDHDMFMASDEDTSSFLRHKLAGTMYNAVYWDTLEIEQPSPRIYFDTTRMYSTEQQILQRRLVAGVLNSVQAHVYQATDEEGLVLYVFDQYRGQCLPIVHDGRSLVAQYYTTYGQTKLAGKMS